MQNAPPTILPTHGTSKPSLSPDPQMPPALLVPHNHQMPQRPLLPEGLQMTPGPLMPHDRQRPQILPLLEGPQMSPESPGNPGLQVFPGPLPPVVAPQVRPRLHVPHEARIREWRGRTRYTAEQKEKLETFFLKKSKYPSYQQRQELAQNIGVIEQQIRVCPHSCSSPTYSV